MVPAQPEIIMTSFTLKTLAPIAAALACLGMGGAQAQTQRPQTQGQLQVVAQVLQRNVVEQERIAADLAHGRIDMPDASLMLAREGRLYLQLAQAFEMGASGADLRGIVEMQVALQQARQAMDEKRFVNAGVHVAREHELMVLALRDAAEQRSLARDWASGRLTLAQLGSLEQVQAQAVAAVE